MPIVKTFDRYVLKLLALSALGIGGGLLFLLMLIRSFRFIREMVRDDLSFSAFFQLMSFNIPIVAEFVLPLAMFIAILIVYSRLYRNSELVIWMTSGMHSWRLALPALAVTFAVMVVMAILTFYLVPFANRAVVQTRNTLQNDIANIFLKEDQFTEVLPGITIFIKKRHANQQFTGLMLHDDRNRQIPETLLAEQGAWQVNDEGSFTLELKNGSLQKVNNETGAPTLAYFSRYLFDLKNSAETTNALLDPDNLYIHELIAELHSGNSKTSLGTLFVRILSPFYILGMAFIALGCFFYAPPKRRGITGRLMTATILMFVFYIIVIFLRNNTYATPSTILLSILTIGGTMLASAVALNQQRIRNLLRGAV